MFTYAHTPPMYVPNHHTLQGSWPVRQVSFAVLMISSQSMDSKHLLTAHLEHALVLIDLVCLCKVHL